MRQSDGLPHIGSAVDAWELIGKDAQKASNLRFKLMHRVYKSQSIWQDYARGSSKIHAHCLWRGRALCV